MGITWRHGQFDTNGEWYVIPVVICDTCGKPIHNSGNVVCTGPDELHFYHKPPCDNYNGMEAGGWEEMDRFLEQLMNNFKKPFKRGMVLEQWPPDEQIEWRRAVRQKED